METEESPRPVECARGIAEGDSRRPGTGLLVLLVDDFHDAREMYAELLELEGFRTAQASTGIEALERAFALLPDLVLMDLSLPGMDGWEATRRLKSDPRTRAIPVVALTGHSADDVSVGAPGAGWDSIVSKPCRPEQLVHAIRQTLARAR